MRLASGVLAAALVRRVGQAGGNGMILARGDATAGAMLIVCRERGVLTALLERILQDDGYAWSSVGPQFDDSRESIIGEWVEKRRSRDPDLWVVELDIVDSQRFAAETLREG